VLAAPAAPAGDLQEQRRLQQRLQLQQRDCKALMQQLGAAQQQAARDARAPGAESYIAALRLDSGGGSAAGAVPPWPAEQKVQLNSRII
jgi:hypothetical protein